MREFFKSKKNVIGICFIIVTIFIISCAFIIPSNSTTSTATHCNSKNIKQFDNAGDSIFDNEANTLSSTSNHSKGSIYYSEEAAVSRIKKIIKERSSKNVMINVLEPGKIYYTAGNISQNRINAKFNEKYKTNINNTCTLVSLTIITKIIMNSSKYIKLNYPNYSNKEDLELAIFKDLYDISCGLNNNYEVGGTSRSTIKFIMSRFYSKHGYNLSIFSNTIDTKGEDEYLRDNLVNYILIPNIANLSIDNYYVESSHYPNASHSVPVVGLYQFPVTYKKIYNLTKTISKMFYGVLICTGWEDSEGGDGEIGNNYQLFIIEDDAESFFECHIENWIS